jgi:prefoldin subunit 5
MAYFERTREAAVEDLQDEIAALSKQLASLRKSIRKRGYAAYGDGRDSAVDLYGEAWERLQEALPMLRKRATQAERAAVDNPLTTAAVVGVVLAGLAIAFVSRR